MNNKAVHVDLRRGLQYLPNILLIALGIGTANYLIHGEISWIQSAILSLSTSLIIGYSLVSVALHKDWLQQLLSPAWKRYAVLAILFILLGILATEVEHLIRFFIFSNEAFSPFSWDNMHLFNGVISLVLGLSFFHGRFLSNEQTDVQENPAQTGKELSGNLSSLSKLPVRQSDSFFLIPIDEIVYFEAYDNYSFVFDIHGKKKLCDYSLLFLQERLPDHFMRVHRKHIVNSRHIKHIQPRLNARYQIEFDAATISPITSSKSYSASIRSLIRIE
ncbi:MAG: LytTR family DNA-binding domain-containing protein [Bacteroidota bacterium]